MNDSEIIAAVRAGNSDAFVALVERYQRTLYYFVVGKVADDTEAKDIVQKSFVAAFQNLADFRLDESFFAWLKGIALNQRRRQKPALSALAWAAVFVVLAALPGVSFFGLRWSAAKMEVAAVEGEVYFIDSSGQSRLTGKQALNKAGQLKTVGQASSADGRRGNHGSRWFSRAGGARH